MSLPIITYDGYSGLMAGALSSFASGANGSRLRLFQNNYYPTKQTLFTDLIEATFTGYSPGIPTSAVDEGLSALFIDLWKFGPITFTMSAGPPQAIFGYWLDFINPLTLLRQLIWVKRFDTPFLFSGPGVSLPVILYPGFSQGA